MNPLSEEAAEKKRIGCAIGYLLLGLSSIVIGFLSIFSDFQEIALNERIKMRPGLPFFDMWKDPAAINMDIGIKVFLFAVENPEEFLSNPRAKLKLREIGPIVYKKVMHNANIVFHEENSTMSFSTVFDMVFDEERNDPRILNQSITIVNPMLMSLASMAHGMFLTRMAFNLAAKDDHVFITRTVYDILWNNTSPIFDFVKRIPFAVPRKNAGIMFNSFFPAENRFNVFIGKKHGYENFFKINTYNGLSQIDAYPENYPKHCPFSLKGSSEGTGLPPHIAKDDVILAYTRNLCRSYKMVYNETIQNRGVEAFKFVLAEEIYTRLENAGLDCLKRTGSVDLPNGLSDASKCALGLPVAVSNPHFWNYSGDWENYLDGLKPSREQHASYVILEPESGLQLEGIARIQSNLPLPSFNHFGPDLRRFSNMVIPQFWMEYFVINDNPVIHAMLIVFLNLPWIQLGCIVLFSVLSAFAFYKVTVLTISFYGKQELCSEPDVAYLQKLLHPPSISR